MDLNRLTSETVGAAIEVHTREKWREEQAKREIGKTEITRAQAAVLASVFIATILTVPVIQHAIGWQEKRQTGSADGLSFCGAFDGVGAAMAKEWREAPSVLRRFLNPNATLLKRIDNSQDAMDKTCFLTGIATPPVQAVLCRLGAGNEKACVGRDGWLFFEPGIRYLTGPGFLDPAQLDRRARTGNEYVAPPQPDPVKAIIHFRDQLLEFGVNLLVMPVPVKASMYPDKFSRRYNSDSKPLQNVSHPKFVKRLQAEDIQVVDMAPTLAALRRGGRQTYLKTDTHWCPDAMEAVADLLAAQLSDEERGVPAIEDRRSITNLGDIGVMLKLPEAQRIYPSETVSIHPAPMIAGDATVLLLGDSFSNIYSLGAMGWGEQAGFAEQLSFCLQQPVDTIIRNDAGAHATRAMLAMDLARGKNRLAGKKVVIWQFSARELAIGDWKLIDLVLGDARADATSVGPAEGVRVTATVSDVSNRPEKGAVYKDFVMKLYVTGMTTVGGDTFGDGDGVVHIFGMRARKILPIAAIQSGARVTLRVCPWEDVAKRYGTMKAGSLGDMMLEIDKTLYWGETW